MSVPEVEFFHTCPVRSPMSREPVTGEVMKSLVYGPASKDPFSIDARGVMETRTAPAGAVGSAQIIAQKRSSATLPLPAPSLPTNLLTWSSFFVEVSGSLHDPTKTSPDEAEG